MTMRDTLLEQLGRRMALATSRQEERAIGRTIVELQEATDFREYQELRSAIVKREGELVRVIGEILIDNRQSIKDLVLDALEEYGHATLDLAGVQRIDPSGIAVLYTLGRLALEKGKQLELVDAPDHFRTFVAHSPAMQPLFAFQEPSHG